jgi:type III pantothenate kinase
MTLLIDLGNTRLKWAKLKADGTLSRQRAASHAGWQSDEFRHALAKTFKPGSDVWVVSVAAERARARLKRALRELSAHHVRFVESAAVCAGVRNGYKDPWRLGADRWVALLGARALAPQRAVLVVDVGTAMTLDILRKDGQHLGGVIVPGADLMQRSLLSSTGGIRRRAGSRPAARGRTASWQAQSTSEAIQRGAQLAAAAVIDAAHVEHRALKPRLLLTGGGAESLQPLLKSPYEWEPDLVLQGLAQVIRSGEQG